jgi:integrase
LKKSGVHVTTAQKLMGHSSPMVTLSIYTGFRDEEISETGEALRKTLGL